MQSMTETSASRYYLVVEQAINFLLEHHTEQPDLATIADHAGLSEFHFQRLFVEWAGISPKRFLQFLTREYMKSLLDQGVSVLDAGYQAGLSGNGRSHELFIKTAAISPAQYKNLGRNLQIYYGIHPSPFGDYLLGITEHGICHLSFIDADTTHIEKQFQDDWSLASLVRDQARTLEVHRQIFTDKGKRDISLLLRGSPFQIQVWQALLGIPFGQVSDYQHLASAMGNAPAVRAAASAIARNRIAYLIPCHRVIRKIGESGKYRWGKARKKALLAYESAISDGQAIPTDVARKR